MRRTMLSSFKRKLEINGKEWSYRITKATIHICNPEQTQKWTYFVNQQEDYDDRSFDADNYDHVDYVDYVDYEPSHSPITPSKVKNLIEVRILKTSKSVIKQLGTKADPFVL